MRTEGMKVIVEPFRGDNLDRTIVAETLNGRTSANALPVC